MSNCFYLPGLGAPCKRPYRLNINPLLVLSILGVMTACLTGCNDGGSNNNQKPAEGPIAKQKAITAMVAVLEQQNLGLRVTRTPSGGAQKPQDKPTTQDYISTDVDPDGDRRLKLYLDKNGNLLPSPQWRQNNPDYCKGQDRYFKGPVKQLRFKVFALPDGYDAFAQYIDISTGKVEEQREGEAANLKDALNKAWNQLQSPVGRAVDPCGEKKGFQLSFQTDITLEVTGSDGTTSTISETVEATVPLSYNKDRQFFEGSSALTWTKFNSKTSAPEVTYDCETPPDANINVIFRAGPKGTPTDSMTASIEFYNIEQCPCEATASGTTVSSPQTSQLITFWFELHKGEKAPNVTYPPNPDRKIGYFTLADWQAVNGNERVIAKKTYDQSTTENSGLFEERTTLEFRKP
jgi:hypothetical protein